MALRCKHVFAVERYVNKWWQKCQLCQHKYKYSKNMAGCQNCHVFAHDKCLQLAGIKEQVSFVADRRATSGGNVWPGKTVMASSARQQQQHVEDGPRSILKKKWNGHAAAVTRRVTFAPVVTSFTIKPHVPMLICEMPEAKVAAEMATADGVVLPNVAKFFRMYKSRGLFGNAMPSRQARRRRRRRQSNADRSAAAE